MRVKPLYIIALLIVISTISSYAQNYKVIFGNVEIGSRKTYKITLTNNQVKVGRIISVDKELVLVSTINKTYTLSTSDVVNVIEKQNAVPAIIGLGYGIPYGFFGMNADIKVIENLYASAGIGSAIFIPDMNVNFGFKYFFRDDIYNWRPRIMTYYGTNSITYSDEYPVFNTRNKGLTVGIGQQLSLGVTRTFGFDFDITYNLAYNDTQATIDNFESLYPNLVLTRSMKLMLSLGAKYNF